MFCSYSSDFHVIKGPAALLAKLSYAVAEPSEELFGVWHITYLWLCQRNNHQQIVGFFLKMASQLRYFDLYRKQKIHKQNVARVVAANCLHQLYSTAFWTKNMQQLAQLTNSIEGEG
jgi:hypothetical protein